MTDVGDCLPNVARFLLLDCCMCCADAGMGMQWFRVCESVEVSVDRIRFTSTSTPVRLRERENGLGAQSGDLEQHPDIELFSSQTPVL